MVTIKKSYLRKFGLAGLLAGVIVVAAASVAVASATPGVQIVTPSLGNIDVYVDANGNGQHEPDEYVGNFPSYQASGLNINWPAYDFQEGVNGAYWVQLWQNTTPLDPQPTWVIRKAAHNFADNPAGNDYLFGPFFNYENICEYCPTMIVIVLESYQYGDGEVLYFPFTANLTEGNPSGFAETDEFVLQNLPGREHKPGGDPPPPVCETPDDSPACCAEEGGSWNGESCDIGPF